MLYEAIERDPHRMWVLRTTETSHTKDNNEIKVISNTYSDTLWTEQVFYDTYSVLHSVIKESQNFSVFRKVFTPFLLPVVYWS